MDLTSDVDADGVRWQMCCICFDWFRHEDLVWDDADGLYWDVCVPCGPEAGV